MNSWRSPVLGPVTCCVIAGVPILSQLLTVPKLQDDAKEEVWKVVLFYEEEPEDLAQNPNQFWQVAEAEFLSKLRMATDKVESVSLEQLGGERPEPYARLVEHVLRTSSAPLALDSPWYNPFRWTFDIRSSPIKGLRFDDYPTLLLAPGSFHVRPSPDGQPIFGPEQIEQSWRIEVPRAPALDSAPGGSRPCPVEVEVTTARASKRHETLICEEVLPGVEQLMRPRQLRITYRQPSLETGLPDLLEEQLVPIGEQDLVVLQPNREPVMEPILLIPLKPTKRKQPPEALVFLFATKPDARYFCAFTGHNELGANRTVIGDPWLECGGGLWDEYLKDRSDQQRAEMIDKRAQGWKVLAAVKQPGRNSVALGLVDGEFEARLFIPEKDDDPAEVKSYRKDEIEGWAESEWNKATTQ